MSDLVKHPNGSISEPAPPRPVAHRYLDTVGLYCPVPILKTAEAIRRMQNGEVLHVVSDDRVILIDMPAWCRSNGQRLLHSEQMGREYHLYVQKAERRAHTAIITD
jgi:tRNA 2-thiouridine synthesizing protein A